MAEIKPDIETFAKIKVVGVGGSGGSAINRMISSKIRGVEFIAMNTDVQALHHSLAATKLHIGKTITRGLGAGMDPDTGARAAEESQNEIREILKGADMVFIDGLKTRDLVERALTLEGATATLAADGQQAVQLLKTRPQRFDAVLMDVKMPDMDGLTVLDELTKTHADVATVLWTKFLKYDSSRPEWPDRDRFVLSNGHGSMLIYALLHLTGYDLPMQELKDFRQLHSKTAGHPETGITPGVETTTGPLGQGISNAVGMALAEKLLALWLEAITAKGTFLLAFVRSDIWRIVLRGCT